MVILKMVDYFINLRTDFPSGILPEDRGSTMNTCHSLGKVDDYRMACI